MAFVSSRLDVRLLGCGKLAYGHLHHSPWETPSAPPPGFPSADRLADNQLFVHHVSGHYYGEGEEFECAAFPDSLPEVKHWVRNIERGHNSFWLQTSSDKFYPDFVARLADGRVLVVEYKGEDRWSNDDSKEKRAVGELWAERSKGKCVFVMPKGPDWAGITSSIRP